MGLLRPQEVKIRRERVGVGCNLRSLGVVISYNSEYSKS